MSKLLPCGESLTVALQLQIPSAVIYGENSKKNTKQFQVWCKIVKLQYSRKLDQLLQACWYYQLIVKRYFGSCLGSLACVNVCLGLFCVGVCVLVSGSVLGAVVRLLLVLVCLLSSSCLSASSLLSVLLFSHLWTSESFLFYIYGPLTLFCCV